MHCRLGTLSDIDEIYILVQKAIHHMERKGIHQWDEHYPTKDDFLEDIEKNTLYIAEENKRIIAIYTINQQCDDEYYDFVWDNPDESACILHRLCVSPDMQNKGIASKLLSHIEHQVREKGYSSIRLDVFSDNPYALKLYEKNNYKQRGYADWRKGRFYLLEKKL